jgi:hypothetical protein
MGLKGEWLWNLNEMELLAYEPMRGRVFWWSRGLATVSRFRNRRYGRFGNLRYGVTVSSCAPSGLSGRMTDENGPVEKKARDERSMRLAYPQADSAPRSNPSPGTKISKPVFG